MTSEEYLKELYTKDLNSKIFYKISFSIMTNVGFENLDLLWEIVIHIKKWLSLKESEDNNYRLTKDIKRWSHFKNGYKLYDLGGNKEFLAESTKRVDPVNEKDVSWACRIIECQHKDNYAPRWWYTEIGFQTWSNAEARISIVLSYRDAMGFIGECQPTPDITIPRIVKNIQRDNRFFCQVNKEPLQFIAIEQKVGQGMDLRDNIYDKRRGIPIILIMPKRDYYDKEKINLPVNPHEMIRSVAGNALVYYSNDLEFVEEFTLLVHPMYKCTAGMIRIYLPNININNPSDNLRHRFIHYDESVALGESKILSIFRRVLSQDINDYDKLFRYADCQELLRRDGLLSKLEKLKKEQEDKFAKEKDDKIAEEQDELLQKYDKMELEMVEVQIENMKLEEQLEANKKEIYNLKNRLDDIMADYGPLKERQDAFCCVREVSDYPDNPDKVFDYFTKVYSDKIVLTENGWKSLKKCLTSPEILWDALYSMVTVLYDSIETSNTFKEACMIYNNQSRYECVAGSTSATKKDKSICKEYEDTYNGEVINIEPHIKSNTGKENDSRFFRIYFNPYKDKKTGKLLIVIGSCGGHLTTAGTNRR